MHTDNARTRTGPGRPPHDEVASTVAVLADEADFAVMRRYPSFAFEDHAAYLRHMDRLLRSLAARGGHTSVARFDPAGYEMYCAHRRLDPDTPASRTRYTAEVAAAGATLEYGGQPLTRLLPRLVEESEQRATWERAGALLTRDDCDACGRDIGRAAFARASLAVRRLVESLGRGTHHLVCSVPAERNAPLAAPMVAVLSVEATTDGRLLVSEPEAMLLCTVLAAGIATGRPGGLVARTRLPGRAESVRGWSLRDGWLRPLTEAEVFAAYCTDAATGEPLPPEPDVEYRAAAELDDGELDDGEPDDGEEADGEEAD
ncbi:hypothetical protein ACIHFE_33325 [Streptomyces sp. NPDC052396]|uniref:hypothetical protein n=1 Tax=Streptomyces sp. NPDC052396 TaxID=3365689 RepID=UPI0037D4C5B6